MAESEVTRYVQEGKSKRLQVDVLSNRKHLQRVCRLILCERVKDKEGDVDGWMMAEECRFAFGLRKSTKKAGHSAG